MQFSLFSFLKEKSIYLWSIVIVINIYNLCPMLDSGYIGDDSIWSYLRGTIEELKQSSLEYYYNQLKGFISIGVFRPFNFYYIFIFTLINSLKVYKFLAMTMIIINLFLFGYFIRLFTRSIIVSILAVELMSILFQFRLYHDPILAFHWQQQTIFSSIVTSLILLIKHLNTKKKYLLYLSTFSYFFALLIHETTYLLCIIYCIVIFFHPSQRSNPLKESKLLYFLKSSSPFLISSIAIISLTLIIRLSFKLPVFVNQSTNVYPNDFALIYVPNLNFLRFLFTYAKQIFAALPLSYFLINPHDSLTYRNDLVKLFISWPSMLNFTIVFGLCFFLLKNLNSKINIHECRHPLKPLLPLGLSFLLLPGILVSLSPRYQYEIVWGLGYIPVYISYFGSSILLTSCICFIYKKFKNCHVSKMIVRIISIGLSFLISCTSTLNYNTNKFVVYNLNLSWLFPRSVIEESIKHGLFKIVPQFSSLLIESNYPWDSRAFYLMHSKVKFDYVGIKGSYLSDPKANNIFKKNISEASDLYAITGNENHFYLRYDSTSEENGYAILGKIRDFKTSNKTLHSAISERIYVYVRYPQNDFKNLSITGFSIDTKHVQYPRSFNTKDLKINLISSGSCWALYELSKPGRLLDLKSINVNSISKHLEFSDWNLWIQLWTGGFSVLEGTPDNNWRWCSSNGDLIIDNKSQKSKKVILEMTLGSGYEEFSDLEIKSPWFYEKLEINVRGKFFSKTITILPGKHIIQFKSNAERVRAPYDRRALVFKVINFRLREFQP